MVFVLSWWLGLYLLARGPGKPVLVLAAVRLCTTPDQPLRATAPAAGYA